MQRVAHSFRRRRRVDSIIVMVIASLLYKKIADPRIASSSKGCESWSCHLRVDRNVLAVAIGVGLARASL